MTAAAQLLILSAPAVKGGTVQGGLREALGLPQDGRGIALAIGALATVGLGLLELLNGDPFGLAYLVAGAVIYLFLHTRLVPGVTFLVLAGLGVYAFVAGNPLAAGLVLLALGLAALSLTPPPAPRVIDRIDPSPIPSNSTPAIATADQPKVVAIPAAKGRLAIRTIGRLQLLFDDQELTAALVRKPTLVFVWTLLLVRALAGKAPLSRDELGQEIAPGLPTKSQRKRVRTVLDDLQRDLPAELSAPMRKFGLDVALDLGDCWIDALVLRDLAAQVDGGEVIAQELADQGRDLIKSLGDGQFLGRFEEFADTVNQGRGGGRELVEQLRAEVSRWRTDVIRALADRAAAGGDHAAAARLLEPLVEADATREDLVRRLIGAYVHSGQIDRANELRRSHGLEEVTWQTPR